MEAQHVESGVCLEVVQNEEQLFLKGVDVAFWPALWNVLNFALLASFQLEGIVSRREGYEKYVEFCKAYANGGFNHAIMFLAIQLFKFFVGHRCLFIVGLKYHIISQY